MATPIPPERIAQILKLGICEPSVAWLSAPGRTYEDLAEKPKWALIAARFPGADVERLQAIIIKYGSMAMRREFAETVPGANKVVLLLKTGS